MMLACRLKIDVPHPSLPGVVADFVEALAEEAGLSPRRAYWLRLATDEITTNIVQHGYRGRPGVVELAGEIEHDRLRVSVEDDAPPFDPACYDPAPRLAPPPGQREEGGYGLLLAMGKVDEFRYEYAGGRNRNILIMHVLGGKHADGPGGRRTG
ncbi:ATP-binding protein [Actinomadura sp. ATCC 31491]|uniref:ATP-binding protein n=1 Tax=Actinomadura luzonensis TaxID=2805427 RepID=A0ABT0G7T5_9ACTN|nr:anti-sigma regulatory factor [Actinomadura luzonensis]MCK2220659.1 ATP-binding protein [Actinomadura luzonensis]